MVTNLKEKVARTCNGTAIFSPIGNRYECLTVLQFDAYCHAYLIKVGLGPNIAREVLYPLTFTDIEGKPLARTKNYTIHFTEIAVARAFWSLTPYNFLNNPINRII